MERINIAVTVNNDDFSTKISLAYSVCTLLIGIKSQAVIPLTIEVVLCTIYIDRSPALLALSSATTVVELM